jgi:hypothetical protein
VTADINVLMSSAHCWEIAGYFSTALVLIGVIGEFVGELTNWVSSELWKRRLLVASTLTLIIGIAAEILTQVQSNSKNSLVIGILNKSVEDERTARVNLEVQIAPRRLDLKQQKSLAALFAKFPGRTVHVSSYMRDHEADFLARQILRAIYDANLQKDDKRMHVDTFGTAIVGICVTGTDISLVKATIETLASFGLGPISEKPIPNNYMNVEEENAPFPLKIFVGMKPLPVVHSALVATQYPAICVR